MFCEIQKYEIDMRLTGRHQLPVVLSCDSSSRTQHRSRITGQPTRRAFLRTFIEHLLTVVSAVPGVLNIVIPPARP